MRTRIIAVIATLVIASGALAQEIPVEDLFRNPEFTGLQLSPSGKYLAALMPLGGHRNVVVLETGNLRNVKQLTGLTDQDVASFFWANDDVVVFTMDNDGNEAFGLYAVNRDRKRPIVRTLIKPEVGQSGIRFAQVVSTLPEDPDHIIVQWNTKRPSYWNLYRVNVNGGRPVLLTENVSDVTGWFVDHDGNPRGAYVVDGLDGKFLYRNADDEGFDTLLEFNILDEGISPMVFSYDNQTMLVGSNIGRDKMALYEFDPSTGELGDMLFAHDKVDIGGPIMSYHRKKLLGVSYFDDYPRIHWFDEEEKKLRETLSAAFPGKRVDIVSASRDESLNVLLVHDDTDPGSYYLYDREQAQVRYLVSRMGWLNPDELVEMHPIEFKARDGLSIPGYLTLPKDYEAGDRVPLVVNPHGGPFGVRDMWGFNPEHQFLANRGYAVVQVNFRGSGGYGRQFEQAGYGKWGQEMQHDITDAVRYLIDEGIVDENRVCIYGASYGGYATMAGLTFTPEVYRCGINYVGVTDVALLFSSMPKHWEPLREVMKIQIGDPKDKEFMDSISPLAHVEKIDDPLFIVHGRKDPRVVIAHAERLSKELKANEKVFDRFYKADEGHSFRKEENRLELYGHIDRFLKEHL
ncbi:MAG: S9 family peptidase [Pseudomonadota bacterium]